MAYYYDHRAEVDEQIAEELAFAESQRRNAEGTTPLQRKLTALG